MKKMCLGLNQANKDVSLLFLVTLTRLKVTVLQCENILFIGIRRVGRSMLMSTTCCVFFHCWDYFFKIVT